MSSNLPSPGRDPLDGRALERILARAAELQGSAADGAEGLTEAQILELGNDVGIAPEHLRRAIAEERSRALVRAEGGIAAVLAGPAGVAAQRIVPGTPSAVLARLDRHMREDEVMTIKRQRPDALVWESQRGLLGGLRRGFALSGRSFHLHGAGDVTAHVTAVDERQVVLRLTADFTLQRETRLAVAGLSWLALVLACAPLFVMGVGLVLAALPPLAVTAAAVHLLRRRHRTVLTRSQVALEQLLDRLELGAR